MKGKASQHLSIIGTKNDWETPKPLFKEAKKLYNINPKLDVCALNHSKMCPDYYGIDHLVRNKRDGLTRDYKKPFFMNPPYDPDYQCADCGAINSFDWEMFFISGENNEHKFMTDMGNQAVAIKDFDDRGFVYSKKRLACKKCGAGNSKRKTLHKGVSEWIKKAYSEHLNNGVDAMILTFAKTDTQWWHKYVEGKAEVHFIKGRIRFLDNGKISGYPAPYGSCWIIYRAS